MKRTFKLRRKSIIHISKESFWSKLFMLIVAVVIWISVMSIFSFNALDKITNPLKFASANHLIVYVMTEPSVSRNESKRLIVYEYLSQNKNIDSVEEVSKEEIRKLLSYWLQNKEIEEFLFLPTVFKNKMSEHSLISKSELQIALNDKVQNVFVETELESLQYLAARALTLKGVNILILIISFVSIVTISTLLTIALLFSHKNLIEILYYMGASNRAIARDFAKWCMKKGTKGAALGSVAATLSTIAISLHFKLSGFLFFAAPALISAAIIPFIVSITIVVTCFIAISRSLRWVI